MFRCCWYFELNAGFNCCCFDFVECLVSFALVVDVVWMIVWL